MQLLREADFKQTRRNAGDVLKDFRRLERVTDRSLIDIKSPIITGMPRVSKHNNKIEGTTIQVMDIETERDAILAVLMALSLISRQTLYYSFCVPDSFSDYRVNRKMGCSERGIQRIRSEALIEFAEAYRHGKAVAYK